MDYILKVIHKFDNDEKLEVSDEFQSVGWNDGDIMMLAGKVKGGVWKQCIENKSIRCN